MRKPLLKHLLLIEKLRERNAFHYFFIAPEPPNVASATSLDHVTYEKRKKRNGFLKVFLENV